MNNSFTCLVKSKPIKQVVSCKIILAECSSLCLTVYVTVGSKKKDCHSNTALLFHTQTSDRGCRLLKSGDEVVKGVKRPQAPIEVQYVTASKLEAPGMKLDQITMLTIRSGLDTAPFRGS